MQTRFSKAQLQDTANANSEGIIRKCVHCGFCTATCPTYLLLGDENDSPRGRIYLMKEMLETQARPSANVVTHIDRCLSCLSCMTTCPSGVNYMQLVDHARAYIQQNYRRSAVDRFWRWVLASVLPHPKRFGAALTVGGLVRGAAPLLRLAPGMAPAGAMLGLVPRRRDRTKLVGQSITKRKGRVILLQGCAEAVLAPRIRVASVRLLNRAGYEVEFVAGEGCCGSLEHHMGLEDASHAAAKRNVEVWWDELASGEVAAILTTVSGCGTTMKNYGFMLRDDPDMAAKAETVAERVQDVSEFLGEIELPGVERETGLVAAYHSPCSLQHGQQVKTTPKTLLEAVGLVVRDIPEGHLCCGSAGVYNILQSEIATKLRDRKLANVGRTQADIVVTSNIGCLTQLNTGARPVLHLVEVLDWMCGGPAPVELGALANKSAVNRIHGNGAEVSAP